MIVFEYRAFKNLNFDGILFSVKLMLGQSVSSGTLPKTALLTWLLSCIFLTEQYRGSNIDQFTSPLPELPLNAFNDIFLNNFTVYSLPNNLVKDSVVEMVRITGMNIKRLANVPVNSVNAGRPIFYDIENQFFAATFNGNISIGHLNSTQQLLRLLYRSKTLLEFINYNKRKLIRHLRKCVREAYVDAFDEVAHIFHLAFNSKNFPVHKLHVNTLPLYSVRLKVQMHSLPVSQTYWKVRFLSIIHSGLPQIWAKWNDIIRLQIHLR